MSRFFKVSNTYMLFQQTHCVGIIIIVIIIYYYFNRPFLKNRQEKKYITKFSNIPLNSFSKSFSMKYGKKMEWMACTQHFHHFLEKILSKFQYLTSVYIEIDSFNTEYLKLYIPTTAYENIGNCDYFSKAVIFLIV